ncbi:MAG: transcription elongation factor GreA [Candidatus Paceibacterota bacterium]|jgi:transcription elongation factor GreA
MASNNIQYLSKEKFEELKQELEVLKTTERKQIAEDLEFARALGDLKENAEYHQARERQADIEDRIFDLENILKTAVIITGDRKGMAFIGSEIKVKKEDTGETKVYVIVGSEEADIAKNKISNTSPLGQAIIGKKVGDTFKVKAPKGDITYKILEIK